jgi:hypothetical protein
MNESRRVYLAGKIEKHCWRHSIVRDLREALTDEPAEIQNCPEPDRHGYVKIGPWPVLREAIFGTHDYVGPFFAACDHGCYHGEDTHGVARSNVVTGACMEAIDRCDVLFAWVDAHDCYGTIAEIGYAFARRKLIWIGGPRLFRDMWFVYSLARDHYVGNGIEPVDLLWALLMPDGLDARHEVWGNAIRHKESRELQAVASRSGRLAGPNGRN